MIEKTVAADESSPGAPRAADVPPHLSFRQIPPGQTKRSRTRSALMDATAALLAKEDPGDIAICDITNAAGLANGTFYYHFSTKAEIIGETAIRIAAHLSAHIYAKGEASADLAERIAAGTRRFVLFCVDNPTWAWALGRSVNYLPAIRKQVYHSMSRTLRRGVDEGVFLIDDLELTCEMFMSMSFAAARASLEGRDPGQTGSAAAEMQLCALGVPRERARLAARADLSPLNIRLNDLDDCFSPWTR